MNGIINFFKPRGMTSHDAVNFFRRLLNIKKIGHSGTLDPNATGVLPICIGRATRVSEYFNEMDKVYIGELTLGMRTDTQDIDGKTLEISKKRVSQEEIYFSFNKFRGQINQIPPMYSALKHKGKKLYQLAREGKTVDRKARAINIKDLRILNNYNNEEIIFYTRCSSGTYIRTLCDDIGEDLSTYGFMSYLIRVGVGDFKIENSYSMDFLNSLSREEILKLLEPMDLALTHLDKIVVESHLHSKLINGVKIPIDNLEYVENKRYRIYCLGKFIGVGRIILGNNKTLLKIDKMLA